jgi:hypothetical protein
MEYTVDWLERVETGTAPATSPLLPYNLTHPSDHATSAILLMYSNKVQLRRRVHYPPKLLDIVTSRTEYGLWLGHAGTFSVQCLCSR